MSILSRRTFLGAVAALPLVTRPALALSEQSARALVEKAVVDINQIIARGGSEGSIISKFGGIFDRYADESYIAAYAMGADARRASAGQRSAFSQAFGDYLTTKYGRRFREFVGGKVIVQSTKPVKNWIEVYAQVQLSGKAPFSVTFFVSDRTGSDKFFNLTIEGVSLLLTEREEIGALLDRNGGNIDAMIAALRGMS